MQLFIYYSLKEPKFRFAFLLIVSFFQFLIEKCNCTADSGLIDTDTSNNVIKHGCESCLFLSKP